MAKKNTHPAKKPTHKTDAPKHKLPAKETAPVRKTTVSKPSVSKPAAKAEMKSDNKTSSTAASHAATNPKTSARDDLRNRVLARAKTSKPIAFSLDEAREVAKSYTSATKPEGAEGELKPQAKTNGKKAELAPEAKPAQPNHVKAASLMDILGFNPKKKANPTVEDEDSIPERFRRYYKLLIELRDHVTGQLDQHTEETLKRSAKEDAGDLSSYGQHMADAGTDTFDRDFALSLVSNEQEALSEIDAAIQRIKLGTYGVCEVTGKPIAKERLLAVPFTRYSTEAQKEIEKNRYRTRQQAGLFGEVNEDGAKIVEDDGGGDE